MRCETFSEKIPRLTRRLEGSVGGKGVCSAWDARRGMFLGVFALLALLETPALAQAPNSFHYVRTDEDPYGVLYDNVRQQFYVAVPGKNEVDVVSGAGLVQAKVNVPSPYALDISPDGSLLYVTSNTAFLGYPAAEGFFVVDTASLKVVDFVQPVVPLNPLQIFFPNLDTTLRFMAAMNNGKVFYNADQRGITSSQIFAYDPLTGISAPRPPTGGGNFYDGSIQKSANGERFVVLSGDSAGGDLWTYDSTSDSYIAHLRINNKVVYDAIFSPDGTRVLAAGHLLYDQNLVAIADLNPTAGFQNYLGSSFSPDSSRIYVVNSYDVTQTLPGGGQVSYSNPVVAVYLTATGALLGYVPAPQFGLSLLNRGIAVNGAGLGILLNGRGFAALDLSHPNPNLSGAVSQVLRFPNVMTPPVGVASAPSAAVVNGAGFRAGVNVYFGSSPASGTSTTSVNTINTQPPPGSLGPVDVSVSFPDGWAIYGPEAYSYGPTILFLDVNAGDVNGGTTVELFGYGFDTSSGQPQVTVGGVPAAVTNVNLYSSIPPFPVESLTFNTPPGQLGFADISVSAGFGSTTLKNGFQYLSHRQIPGVLPSQMVLDETRGRLYVADVVTGDVKSVDVNTLTVSTLISSSGKPASALATTPDGSKLLVLSSGGGTLTVFDLNGGSVLNSFIPVPGNQPTSFIANNVVATSRGTAIVSLQDPASFDGGAVYEVDLSNGTAAPFAAPCGATALTLFAPAADGSHIYMTPSSGLCLGVWSASLDAVAQQQSYAASAFQFSATALGDRVLASSPTYTRFPAISLVTTLAPNEALVALRSLVAGGKIHSSGSLEYTPTTKGIEVGDVQHGQVVLSIGIPGGVASTFDGLVVNRAGTSLYVAEATGIGAVQLAAAPLSIGSLQPAQGDSHGGVTVTVLGSGFVNGSTVTLDGQPAAVQFFDSTKLTFVSPATSSKKVSLTVTNPVGDSYTLDAAYDASLHPSSPVPTLTSLSPATLQTDYSTQLTINGTGFVAGSQVQVNGEAVETHYLSSTQIVAYLYTVRGPGQPAITVVNPPPGGGVSNVLNLLVKDANPNITSLNPSSISAGSPSFFLQVIDGKTTSFGPDSQVLWNGSVRPTTFVATSELLAQISASDVAVQGTAAVTVNTPSAANPTSNAMTFTITPAVALITVQPLNVSFGPQVISTKSAPATVTLASTGQLPLQISGISLADTVNFGQTNNCPASLSPGQSCTIQLAFAPPALAAVGQVLSKLTIVDNAASSPETVNLTGEVVDFGVQAQSNTLSVKAGQSATDTLTVISFGGALSNQVQLSCSGLPIGAACNFDPASVIPNVAGIPVTLTIKTTGSASSASIIILQGIVVAGLPCIVLLAGFAARRNRKCPLAFLVFFAALSVNACGGGGNGSSNPPPNPNQTPAGTYTIIVTAAYGPTANRTVTITLSVNAP